MLTVAQDCRAILVAGSKCQAMRIYSLCKMSYSKRNTTVKHATRSLEHHHQPACCKTCINPAMFNVIRSEIPRSTHVCTYMLPHEVGMPRAFA